MLANTGQKQIKKHRQYTNH